MIKSNTFCVLVFILLMLLLTLFTADILNRSRKLLQYIPETKKFISDYFLYEVIIKEINVHRSQMNVLTDCIVKGIAIRYMSTS